MKSVDSKRGGDILGRAAYYEKEGKGIDLPFPKLFGRLADATIEKYGLDKERYLNALAKISCINYANAKRNPLAKTRKWFMSYYAKKALFEKYGYYRTDYKIAADFELMLRFIYVNRVKSKYVPETLMTFRVGGVSTQLSNKMLINKETVRACKENGLFCCTPMVWLKYFFKLNRLF